MPARNSLVTGLALATLLASPLAMAAKDSGVFMGLGVGQATFDDSATVNGTAVSVDDDDIGWRFFAGYQLNKNFAIEGGWTDLGDFSGTVGATGFNVEVEGFTMSGVGILPINDKFDLRAKAGVFMWDADVDAGAGGASSDGNDFTFGLGAVYHFTDNIGFRLEWDRYDADADLDMITLSIQMSI